MKKIFSIFAIIAISFSITSCRGEGERVYGGDSQLLFTARVNTGNALVLKGSGSADYKLNFGVVKPSDVDNQVIVEVDPKNTTAVEGTDYSIPAKTTTLQAGSATGFFTIKLLEGGATTAGKKIAFKIKSPTLANAGFNQDFTLIVNLTCPVSSFLGDFTNTTSTFFNPGSVVSVVQSPTVTNQLILKNYFNNDIILNYDPATYIITVPTQNTGLSYSTYGLVSITKPKDATKLSSFNPCTRVLTLNVGYFVSAGSFGDNLEVFNGK